MRCVIGKAGPYAIKYMRALRWTGHNHCMRGKFGCWVNPHKWVIFHGLPVLQHVISWKYFPYFHLQSFETCDRRRVTPGWIPNRLHQTFETIDGHNLTCFQVQCTHLPAILDWGASKTRFGDFCSLKIRVLMKSTAATFHVQDNYWVLTQTKASNDDGCQSQHLFLDCDQSRIIFCLLTPVGPSCSKSALTNFKI